MSASRSIPQLLTDAKADASAIASDLTTLAKAETGESAKKAGIGAALMVLALGLAWFALVALTIAFGFGLVAAGLPIWASFLIVFGVFVLIAAILVFVAIRLFKQVKAPTRTIAAVKASVAAMTGKAADATDSLGLSTDDLADLAASSFD